MSMVHLNEDSVTPDDVLADVMEHNDLAHIYVVAVTDDGIFLSWASGDMSRMAEAALLLTKRSTALVCGKVP